MISAGFGLKEFSWFGWFGSAVPRSSLVCKQAIFGRYPDAHYQRCTPRSIQYVLGMLVFEVKMISTILVMTRGSNIMGVGARPLLIPFVLPRAPEPMRWLFGPIEILGVKCLTQFYTVDGCTGA